MGLYIRYMYIMIIGFIIYIRIYDFSLFGVGLGWCIIRLWIIGFSDFFCLGVEGFN